MIQPDRLFQALSLFRRRRFTECVQITTEILQENPNDQVVWLLKMRALTEQVYVDESEPNEEALTDLLDENHFHSKPKPGTSVRLGTSDMSPAIRPMTKGRRPITGMVRLNQSSNQQGNSVERALQSSRGVTAQRPVTNAGGRFVRLGTASMLNSPDGPFIQVSRLNLERYSRKESIAPALFEHLFYEMNEIRIALEFANFVSDSKNNKDWWWLLQTGKCYFRLEMFRESEKSFLLSLEIHPMVDTYLHLSKLYLRRDQPLSAIQKLNEGIEQFPEEPSLLQGIARIHESLNNIPESIQFYRRVLKLDNTNIEAISCIAAHHFYEDQPEISLKFYRRLLQMGVMNASILNNVALCCFHAQQFDMIIGCFLKSLVIVRTDEERAEIWYNIGEMALYTAETKLAIQCFRLALVFNSDHAEAYNNFSLLEIQLGHMETATNLMQIAQSLSMDMFESFYNFAQAMYQESDYQSCFRAIEQSLQIYPEHSESKEIQHRLKTALSEL